VVARSVRPRLASREAMAPVIREALLEYHDGRTRSVPVCEPAPAMIVECATPAGLIESGYERGQRRFGRAKAARSHVLRYVEAEVITAAFRCDACGCAAGLAYLPRAPRSYDFGRLPGARPTRIAGVRRQLRQRQLCWPCYAAWARTRPEGIVSRVAQTFGWVTGTLPKELRRAHALVAGGVGGRRS
jgi:hypothetical protein